MLSLKTRETNYLFLALTQYPSWCYADVSLQIVHCSPTLGHYLWHLQKGQMFLKTFSKCCMHVKVSKHHPFKGSHKPSCPQNESVFSSPSTNKVLFLVSTTAESVQPCLAVSFQATSRHRAQLLQ